MRRTVGFLANRSPTVTCPQKMWSSWKRVSGERTDRKQSKIIRRMVEGEARSNSERVSGL